MSTIRLYNNDCLDTLVDSIRVVNRIKMEKI